MVSDSLKYYQPTSKAWIGFSILCLSIAAIVYAVVSSDIKVKVGTSLMLDVQTNDAAQDIHLHVEQKVGL